MFKWLTLIMGFVALALGVVVMVEGSQNIAGIAIIAVSGLIILTGIVLLLLKKKGTVHKGATTDTPAASEPEEDPPVF